MLDFVITGNLNLRRYFLIKYHALYISLNIMHVYLNILLRILLKQKILTIKGELKKIGTMFCTYKNVIKLIFYAHKIIYI